MASPDRRPTIEASDRSTKEYAVSSNDDLAADVSAELRWDPKVDNAAVAVSADDGAITLRGTVGSLRQKREAQKAAQRVYGVTSVHNRLQVRLLNGGARDDADLRGDVLQALVLDSLVPKTVDAKVTAGLVTLTGTVTWRYQRDEADAVASYIGGVIEVLDEIAIMPPAPDARDAKEAIKKAFKRNAAFDADDLHVSTDNGAVTIKGTVRSWAEHDEAIAGAWAAPGVTSVRDDMTVSY
jgi:osmotically-inducible protein OsmY